MSTNNFYECGGLTGIGSGFLSSCCSLFCSSDICWLLLEKCSFMKEHPLQAVKTITEQIIGVKKLIMSIF